MFVRVRIAPPGGTCQSRGGCATQRSSRILKEFGQKQFEQALSSAVKDELGVALAFHPRAEEQRAVATLVQRLVR